MNLKTESTEEKSGLLVSMVLRREFGENVSSRNWKR